MSAPATSNRLLSRILQCLATRHFSIERFPSSVTLKCRRSARTERDANHITKGPEVGIESERNVQRERNSQKRAENFYARQIHDHLKPSMQEFIRRQEMVFIATADSSGSCDCSPRFGKVGFVEIVDQQTLVFPEFRGNGVFASLGNISENPNIGLLFLDFLKTSVGLHVNGTAKRCPPNEIPRSANNASNHYDTNSDRLIEQWVYVSIEEAHIHCSKHVPKMKKVDKHIHWGTDNGTYKSSDFFLKEKS